MLRRSRRLVSARHNLRSLRERYRVHLRVEQLESRVLLSARPVTLPPPGAFTPAQIRHAYGFDQVAANGAGQTIAIVAAHDDPNIAGDLHSFDQYFGLPDPVFTKATPQGTPQGDPAWGLEISLSVEWAHAIAQGANILLVEAPTDGLSFLLNAVDYAKNQAGVAVVSMSWGTGEFAGETAADAHFTTPAGHSGVTFVAASGDHGVPPQWPAVSPNVLAVGGTTLTTDGTGNWLRETGWSGSGGGISAYESQPSYQNGVVTQTTTQRVNPDVAYNADPMTPFAVFDSYGSSGWLAVGGTSAGAPQWSALVAIADQARATAGKAALDGPTQTLPALYQTASSFHDITSGNNGFSAGPGFDLVTGLGTPKANLIIPALVSQVSSTPQTAGTVATSPTTKPTSPTTKPAAPPSTAKATPASILSSNSAEALIFQLFPLFSPATLATRIVVPAPPAASVPVSPVVSNSSLGLFGPQPAQSQPGQSLNALIGSGGGDNGVISGGEDVDDNPAGWPLPVLDTDASDGLMASTLTAPDVETQAVPATWSERCTVYFTHEEQTVGRTDQDHPLSSARVSDPSPHADPVAAMAGLALVLGSYWSRRPEGSNPQWRSLPRFDPWRHDQ